MKKMILKRFISAMVAMAAIVVCFSFSSCSNTQEIEYDSDGCYKAVVGAYDEDKDSKKSVIEGVEYLNLFGTRIFYTFPKVKTWIPVEGNADAWEYYDGMYLASPYSINGKLVITPNESGYMYLINNETQEIIKIYANEAVERTADRKQTDKKLPYMLYFEKGQYGDNFKEGSCCLTVYKVDTKGYYTVPYMTFCSACGSMAAKTPAGIHIIGTDGDVGGFERSEKRERWHNWGGGYYGQYVTNYSGGVYLHGPTGSGTYEYSCLVSSYNQVGTHASGGCLRMQCGSAYWIFTNCPNGTKLEIVDGNPRGTAIDTPKYLKGDFCYDPTDPILLTGTIIE